MNYKNKYSQGNNDEDFIFKNFSFYIVMFLISFIFVYKSILFFNTLSQPKIGDILSFDKVHVPVTMPYSSTTNTLNYMILSKTLIKVKTINNSGLQNDFSISLKKLLKENSTMTIISESSNDSRLLVDWSSESNNQSINNLLTILISKKEWIYLKNILQSQGVIFVSSSENLL